MQKLTNGKFEVTIGGIVKTVVMTFGVRNEVLKIITRKQLEYRSISSKNMLPTDLRAKLAEVVETLEAERSKPVLDGEAVEGIVYRDLTRVEELQTAVNSLYEESIKTIDANKDIITERLAVGMIDLTDEAIADIVAELLTTRDKEGNITNKVTRQEILHGYQYADDSDELLSLIEAVMEYLIEALKKIQLVSNLVSQLVRPD